jgi:hypothetical protein
MKIDRENTNPKYWEEVLKSENLGMDRGAQIQDVFAESEYAARQFAKGHPALTEDEAVKEGFIIDHEVEE